jgi:hypothetical protein
MPQPTGEPRESPISFRPGKLRTVIRQRAVRSLTDGQIVKRDLGRYYLLLGQALLDVRLTRHEAVWLAKTAFFQGTEDALSGDPFIPEHVNPSDYLMSIVKRATAGVERQGRPASDLAYQVSDKVEKMTPLQRAAVVDALDRLPAESEEEIYDPGNWSLIGMPLADDPLTAADVIKRDHTAS